MKHGSILFSLSCQGGATRRVYTGHAHCPQISTHAGGGSKPRHTCYLYAPSQDKNKASHIPTVLEYSVPGSRTHAGGTESCTNTLHTIRTPRSNTPHREKGTKKEECSTENRYTGEYRVFLTPPFSVQYISGLNLCHHHPALLGAIDIRYD